MPEKNQDTSATRSFEAFKVWVKPEAMPLRPVSTATSSSGDGIMTPTSSYFEQPLITSWSVPRPGRTYRIHLKGTDKVIMVVDGRVVVQPIAEAKLGGGWNWACVENGNWLGFRNHVSGKYLGRIEIGRMSGNTSSCIRAESSHQRSDEYFCVRQHPDGGYLLFVNASASGTRELHQVRLDSDEKGLVGKHKGGALWLFEEV